MSDSASNVTSKKSRGVDTTANAQSDPDPGGVSPGDPEPEKTIAYAALAFSGGWLISPHLYNNALLWWLIPIIVVLCGTGLWAKGNAKKNRSSEVKQIEKE